MVGVEIVISIIIFLLGGMGVMVKMLRQSDLEKLARKDEMEKLMETLNNLVSATTTLKLDIERNYVRKDTINGQLLTIRAEQEGQRKLINQRFNNLEKTIAELKTKIGG